MAFRIHFPQRIASTLGRRSIARDSPELLNVARTSVRSFDDSVVEPARNPSVRRGRGAGDTARVSSMLLDITGKRGMRRRVVLPEAHCRGSAA